MDKSLGSIHSREMGSTKFKIVFVHQDSLITGSAISLRNIINPIDKNQYEIVIVTPKLGPAITIWENAGAQVLVYSFRTFWTSPGPKCISRGALKQLLAIIPSKKTKAFITSLKPDILHINDKAAIHVGVSCKNSTFPIVQHSRSAYHLTYCKLMGKLSAMLIKSYANHIICISEDEVQYFENFKNKTILYNTVNFNEAKSAINSKQETRRLLNIEDKDIVIGMAENFSVYKGINEIKEITFQLKDKKDNLKFLLVGKIDEHDNIETEFGNVSSMQYLQKFINQHNLTANFILTGYQTKPLNYIAAMDLLIVAKAHGVLGRQPIEAQSVGTTVVALNGHSKQSKIVLNDSTGYLVDSVDELVKKIEYLIVNPTVIAKMSKEGLKHAELNFSDETYFDKLKTIYNKLH